MNKVQLPFYVKLACVLLSLVLITYIAYFGEEIIAPMLFALLFTMLLLGFCNFLERRIHLPRLLASITSVIMLILVVALIFYFIAAQISSFTKNWPLLRNQIIQSFNDLQRWINQNYHVTESKQQNFINSATENISSSSIIGHTVLSVSSTLLFIIFIPIYTFFLLYYRGLFMKFLIALFPDHHTDKVYEIVHQVQFIIKKYIVGLFLEMVIIAVLLCSTFLILGIKYATMLGVLTAIFNIIPYVGMYSSIVVCVLLTFASAGASKAIIVGLAMLLVHTLDSNFLMPRIVGSQVKINAIITIIGVIIGNLLWGIAGMFLAIPVIAILKIIFDRVEGLEPWGLILGDDPREGIKKLKKVKIKIPAKESKPAK
jgi:putative permease